jgi:hypothetical protein
MALGLLPVLSFGALVALPSVPFVVAVIAVSAVVAVSAITPDFCFFPLVFAVRYPAAITNARTPIALQVAGNFVEFGFAFTVFAFTAFFPGLSGDFFGRGFVFLLAMVRVLRLPFEVRGFFGVALVRGLAAAVRFRIRFVAVIASILVRLSACFFPARKTLQIR